jgi:hypothetical protein
VLARPASEGFGHIVNHIQMHDEPPRVPAAAVRQNDDQLSAVPAIPSRRHMQQQVPIMRRAGARNGIGYNRQFDGSESLESLTYSRAPPPVDMTRF